jgi:photosystem II stability/assembly factor-like uncharacterized protein
VLATVSGGESWSEQFGSPVDLYRVRFADANRGWLVGTRGKFWHTVDSGNTWNSAKVPDVDEVAASALALTPNGLLSVAPLWQGEVLVTSDGQTWHKINLGDGFGYSMPSAAVFDDGFVIVLSADGRIAMSQIR